MKRSILVLSLLSAFALSAHATPPGNNGGGNGGCGVGQQTNGCGGQGGAGGNGGAGGSATAAAQANAAAIAAQAQRQAQRQSQALTSTNTNTLNGAPVTVSVGVTVPTAQATDGDKLALSTVTEKAEPVIVPEYRDVRPVSSAYAPNINPTSPCALTVSGGVQARDFGFSFGGTPIADFCEKLEIARSAYNEGEAEVAKEVKCGIPAYRAARLRVKKPCAEDAAKAEAKRAESILNGEPVAPRQVTAAASLDLLP
ncbi:hypothetical protein LJR084_001866 [Variovorax sp. LjRoot84]|uniref:hypothetical protein n=1 Tax=Variovorax sp. LjRoot84 TaxID=3342340 RepID=UPI003ECD0EBA